MKLIVTTLFILLTINLNAQLDFYNCPLKSKKEFVENASLAYNITLSGKDTIFYTSKIDTGNSVVFNYSYNYSCDKTFHEAVSTYLEWSIPGNKTSFKFEFTNIDSLKFPLIYKTGCGPPCRKYNFDLIAGFGILEGQLIKNTWIIKGEIKMKLLNRQTKVVGEKEISIDDTFVLWKQKKKDKKGYKFNGF